MLFIRQFGFGKLAGVIGCARIIISFFLDRKFLSFGDTYESTYDSTYGSPYGFTLWVNLWVKPDSHYPA